MREDLRQRLASSDRTLVADGATGTELQARGMPPGGCSELWCVERPDAVRDIAATYAAAGSDLVYTNSFGANRWRLAHYGLADRLTELNEAAARLAREGAGEEVYVIGSMGPSGDFLEPLGELSAAEVSAAYGQQAQALLAGGADALVLETFAALEEIEAAALGVRAVTDAPLLASLTYGSSLRTMMGVTPDQAAATLAAAGVDVLGLNCGDDIAVVEPILAAYAEAGRPLFAKPNAGLPQMVEGELTWPISPAEFAALAAGWATAGARIVGGCCGTGPAHIRALAAMVRGG